MKRAHPGRYSELVKRLKKPVTKKSELAPAVISIQNDQLSNLIFDSEQNILSLKKENDDLLEEDKKLDENLQTALNFARKFYKSPNLNFEIDYENNQYIPFKSLLPSHLTAADIEKLNAVFKCETLNFEKQLVEKDIEAMKIKLERKDKRIFKLNESLEHLDNAGTSGIAGQVNGTHISMPSVLNSNGSYSSPLDSGLVNGDISVNGFFSQNSTSEDLPNGYIKSENTSEAYENYKIKTQEKDKINQLKKGQKELLEYESMVLSLSNQIEKASLQVKQNSLTNQTSPEIQNFIQTFVQLKLDFTAFLHVYEKNRQEFTMQWLKNFENLNRLEYEEAISQKNFKSQLIFFEQKNLKLKRENDALQLEMDKMQASLNQGETIKKETRQLIESYRINSKSVSEQTTRNEQIIDHFKKIISISKEEDEKYREQKEKEWNEQEKQEQDLKEKDSKESGVVADNGDSSQNEEGELQETRAKIAQVQDEQKEVNETLENVNMLLECYKTQPPVVHEKVEVMCKEIKLKKEMEELTKKVEEITNSKTYTSWKKKLELCVDILRKVLILKMSHKSKKQTGNQKKMAQASFPFSRL